MSDYRVDIKVRNNNILSLIESRGYVSAFQFCNSTGYTYNTLIKLINMKESPLGANGDYRPAVHNLCEKLNCLPEELFSSAQMEAVLEDNRRTFEVNEAEMKFMLSNQQEQRLLEDIVDDDKREAALEDMLDTLCPREKSIIERRFGLGEYDTHTYDELASHFGVTRERVRQIERKAMLKLRHPSRRDILNGLFEGIGNE